MTENIAGNTGPTDWKAMTDFAAGIDANRMPTTDALAGQTLTWTLADGTTMSCSFGGPHQVAWQRDGRSGVDWYEAIEIRDGLFFVDQTFSDRPMESTVTILNRHSGRVLEVASIIADEPIVGSPRVSQPFTPGTIDGVPVTGMEPAPSRDFIGWRALYRYSPNHLYEHVYLSSTRYCWQCLIGEQRGHGDVDMTQTWKFEDDIYAFTFTEFLIPVGATWLYDLDAMRTTGRFWGLGDDGAVNNSPGGAFITDLGRVTYPADGEPV